MVVANAVVAALVAISAFAGVAARPLDVAILGGRLVDGSGNPAYKADIGVRDGRIVTIGHVGRHSAREIIDATGQLVSPGFIDLHSHAFDYTGPGGTRAPQDDDPRRLTAPNLITQGVTTVVINQDGRSPPAVRQQRVFLERAGIGVNAALLVGHGSVRSAVLGKDVERAATPGEIVRMRELVSEAMRDGAFGLSAGLEYAPGRWSNTDEIVALVEVIVPYRGVYVSHERSEGSDPLWYWPSLDGPGAPSLIDALGETIAIGERTGATVVASHLKAKGAHYWGASRVAIQLIESARARGVEVYADHYPYDTTGTDGATVLLPPWALEPGTRGIVAENIPGASRTPYAERVEAILAVPDRQAALRGDVAHEIRRRGGSARITVMDHPDPTYRGRTLAEIAEDNGVDAIDMAIRLQTGGYRDRAGGAQLRGFSLSEIDIDLLAARNWVATASDAGIALPGDAGSSLHPRYFGTFPRKIRRYALERGVLGLEDAIRSATMLPAQILGLRDRGSLRVGAVADIVIFDPSEIADTATAARPVPRPGWRGWWQLQSHRRGRESR